eukprot:3761120-Amphidinium_carterae.1
MVSVDFGGKKGKPSAPEYSSLHSAASIFGFGTVPPDEDVLPSEVHAKLDFRLCHARCTHLHCRNLSCQHKRHTGVGEGKHCQRPSRP